MHKKHKRKMVAPIIIALIFVLYYTLIASVCWWIPIPIWIKLCLVIIPLALAGVMIFVVIERINEIRSGEEDDLSQY